MFVLEPQVEAGEVQFLLERLQTFLDAWRKLYALLPDA
jgi:hypothetical protein